LGRYMYLIQHYPDVGQYHEALENIRLCREQLAAAQVKQAKEINEGLE
jgi:hypothetical protein